MRTAPIRGYALRVAGLPGNLSKADKPQDLAILIFFAVSGCSNAFLGTVI